MTSGRQTDRLDVGVVRQRDRLVELQYGDVVLQCPAVVVWVLYDEGHLEGEGCGLVLLVQGGVAQSDVQLGGVQTVSAVGGRDDVHVPH